MLKEDLEGKPLSHAMKIAENILIENIGLREELMNLGAELNNMRRSVK